MIKNAVKSLIPPILILLLRKVFPPPEESPSELFEGDDELFKKVVREANIYGEYGCGKSTKWVLANTTANVIGVDTSSEWIEKVISDSENNEKLTLTHIDLGPVGLWGTPIDYSKRTDFADYTDFMWKQDSKPDVILVDGRFRVCCFLTTLKYADEGTYILFDDYTDRPQYHFVEKYVDRVEECGRQCLFVVPPSRKLPLDELNEDIANFRYVLE